MKYFLNIFFIFFPLFYQLADTIEHCDIPVGNIDSSSASSPEECLELCKKNESCIAATFISGWDKCFLKNTNKKFYGVRIYSGIIDRLEINKIIEEAYDIDYPVGDIKKIDNLRKHQECKIACLKEPKCKAFSFIERYNTCWLKDRHNKKQKKIFYCLDK